MRIRPIQLLIPRLLICVIPLKAQATRDCVHLKVDGGTYSLAYNSDGCTHKEFSQLPCSQFQALRSWAYNSSHHKVLSLANQFKINARLAALDNNHVHGVSNGPCGFGLWSKYAWADHADFAYFALKRGVAGTQAILSKMETDSVSLRLAKRDSEFGIRFKRSRLSEGSRSNLIKLLRGIEAEVQLVPSAASPEVPLESHLLENPRHTMVLTQFQVVD